jgi:hypothetical protein
MRYETSGTVAATPERLWAVLTDVERWPEWIDVYEQVRLDGPLRLGSTARVKQRGLVAGTWTVTELEEGRAFGWESRQPGVRLVARHLVDPAAAGSRLTLQLEQSGWASGVVAALMGSRIRRYVDLECARLTAVAAAPTTR